MSIKKRNKEWKILSREQKIKYIKKVLAGYPDRPHPNKTKIEAQLKELEEMR